MDGSSIEGWIVVGVIEDVELLGAGVGFSVVVGVSFWAVICPVVTFSTVDGIWMGSDGVGASAGV